MLINTAILGGSRPVPAKRSAVSTAPTSRSNKQKNIRSLIITTHCYSQLTPLDLLQQVGTSTAETGKKWEASKQLWYRTKRNTSAGTDHLAKQRSQHRSDARTHAQTSITRKTPIWSIKCLQREIRFIDVPLRPKLQLNELRRPTSILSDSPQRTLTFRYSLLRIAIQNTGKIIKAKVWGGAGGGRLEGEFRVLILW
jgi:hypothetical protein